MLTAYYDTVDTAEFRKQKFRSVRNKSSQVLNYLPTGYIYIRELSPPASLTMLVFEKRDSLLKRTVNYYYTIAPILEAATRVASWEASAWYRRGGCSSAMKARLEEVRLVDARLGQEAGDSEDSYSIHGIIIAPELDI